MTPIYQAALEQLKAENFAAAIASFTQVIDAQPDFAEAYYQRGQIQAKLGNLQQAIADYTEALQLQPTAQAFLKRAMASLLIGETERAIADAHQATHLDLQLALAPHLLGKAYAQLGKPSDAIVAYKQATQRYLALQDKPNASACIAQIEALQAPLSPAPAQPKPLDPAVIQQFLQQATAKLDRGDARAALIDLEWLLHLEPNHPQSLCLFATVQAKSGNGQTALQAIARALQTDPNNPELRFHRGTVHLLLGDARGAIQEFTQLLTQDNANARFYLQRGQCYFQMNDFDTAFKDCANAIGIAPENPEGYLLRAAIHQATNDLEAALADYQQAASLWLKQGDWHNQQKTLMQITALQAQSQQKQAAKSAATLIRIPIKYLYNSLPVIDIVLNGQYTFEMIVDKNCNMTLISDRMAIILGIKPTGRCWGRFADGNSMEFESGMLRSLTIGATAFSTSTHQVSTLEDVQVAIANSESENIGLVGQNVLNHYLVSVLPHEIEFQPK
jgi:tetratricopeptide (TPR) repeat protein